VRSPRQVGMLLASKNLNASRGSNSAQFPRIQGAEMCSAGCHTWAQPRVLTLLTARNASQSASPPKNVPPPRPLTDAWSYLGPFSCTFWRISAFLVKSDSGHGQVRLSQDMANEE
jgi:hypothetical protein